MRINGDNKEVTLTYNNLKQNGLYTNNYVKNVETIDFQETDLLYAGEGLYKPSTNTVYYNTYERDMILHELLHAAMYDGTNQVFYVKGKKYYKSSGFTLVNETPNRIGIAISEGLTEYYRMLLYNNGKIERNKLSCYEYYQAALLSKLLIDLIGQNKISDLAFRNDLMGFYSLLRNQLGDTYGSIVSLADNIFNLDSRSFLSRFFKNSSKIQLTNFLIELAYNNIENKDLEEIFSNYIDKYFEDETKGYDATHKRLEKTKRKYKR
jgi:hypothetical protein